MVAVKSYIEDLNFVQRLLDKSKEFIEEYEIIYEAYNSLEKSLNEFKECLDDFGSVDFEKSYKLLQQRYINLEYKIRNYDKEYFKISNMRQITKVCYKSFMDEFKEDPMYWIDNSFDKHNINELKRLVYESDCISFYLTNEELNIVNRIYDM